MTTTTTTIATSNEIVAYKSIRDNSERRRKSQSVLRAFKENYYLVCLSSNNNNHDDIENDQHKRAPCHLPGNINNNSDLVELLTGSRAAPTQAARRLALVLFIHLWDLNAASICVIWSARWPHPWQEQITPLAYLIRRRAFTWPSGQTKVVVVVVVGAVVVVVAGSHLRRAFHGKLIIVVVVRAASAALTLDRSPLPGPSLLLTIK